MACPPVSPRPSRTGGQATGGTKARSFDFHAEGERFCPGEIFKVTYTFRADGDLTLAELRRRGRAGGNLPTSEGRRPVLSA
jgi:hypothetical protein